MFGRIHARQPFFGLPRSEIPGSVATSIKMLIIVAVTAGILEIEENTSMMCSVVMIPCGGKVCLFHLIKGLLIAFGKE